MLKIFMLLFLKSLISNLYFNSKINFTIQNELVNRKFQNYECKVLSFVKETVN